ncbi:MAG: glycosyl hydrolase family 18 protein [Ilumatobacteraceae bacterium]
MDHTPAAPERTDAGDHRRPRLFALGAAAVLSIVAAVGYVVSGSDEAPPWKRTGPPITVQGWAPYWQTDSALASFTANADVFTDLSLFAYRATAANAIDAYPGLAVSVPATYRAAVDTAGVKLTASILDDTGTGVMASILADPVARATHVQTIVQFATANGFDGIDVDYEGFAFSDGRSTWATTRPNWVLFIQELAAGLHGIDKTLTVSAPPMYDPDRTGGDRGYWVYDYAAMGEVVDFIRIMAYDYNTSEPGPIAPIGWVQGLVDDIKAMVPPSKLILGVPVYGYNWPTSILGVCPADQEPKRQNQSTKSAAVLAASKGIVPTYDVERAESTFSYLENLVGVDASGAPTECTVNRTVWFSDARAAHQRAWTAERADLAGIAIWALGSDDELVWQGIDAARADIASWPVATDDPGSSIATSLTTAPVPIP